jgi:hypothetical protein
MKLIQKVAMTLLAHVLVIGSAGCTDNRTESMAATCQNLLDDSDHGNDKRFLRDADEQLEALRMPPVRVEAFRRSLEDRDAMKFRQALQECVWQLKSRQ